MISDQELLAQKIVAGKVVVLKLWARVETQAVGLCALGEVLVLAKNQIRARNCAIVCA